MDVVFRAAPLPADGEFLPVGGDAGIDGDAVEVRTDAQHVLGGREVGPAGGTGHEGMARTAVGGVVLAHHELAVGVRLGLANLDDIILQCRTQGVVELHCPAAAAQNGLGAPRPGVGMAEHGAVFFQARIHPGDEADAVVGGGEAGGVEHQTVGGVQVLVHAVHGGDAMLVIGDAGKYGPSVALHVYPALGVRLRADLAVSGGDAADVPLAVPEHGLADFLDMLGDLCVFGCVLHLAQLLGQRDEVLERPVVQETDHGAFAAAKVQAVVPVGAQTLADAVDAHLPGREVQNALHMLVDRTLAAVGVGHHLMGKGHVAGFPDVLDDGGHQPQGVVGAGVLQTVDDLALIRGGNHCGGLEGLGLFLRLEPAGLEQVQAVALFRQRTQQLDDAAAALVGVGMGDRHGVLGGVPVAKAGSAAHLNEGGEPGEHDVDLALIQVPDVQLGVHALVGGGHLQAAELVVPEFQQTGKVLVGSGLGVLLTHFLTGFDAALAQEEQEAGFLAGLKGEHLLQDAAMIAALFKRAAAHTGLHHQWIAFGAVAADKAVAQAVKAVRGKIGSKELVAVLFVVEVVFDDTVFVPAAGGVQTHLEVLVVHVHLVEAEFQIGEHGKMAHFIRIVAQLHVPDLHGVVHGDKELLLGVDACVIGVILDVAQAVTAGEMLLGLAHRLPGDAPVVAGVLIPQVHVMSGAVHGNAVGTEPGDAMVFRRFVQQVSARRVVEYAIHILEADIVGPGNGDIYPIDDIFPMLIVKVPITHKVTSA